MSVEGESITEYCKKLEIWLWRAYYQRSLAISAYMTALYGQPSGPPLNNNYMSPPTGAAGNGGVAVGAGAGATANVLIVQRREASTALIARVAPVWRRVASEFVDFAFLLLVKLFITFTIIDSFELIDLESLDIESLRGGGAEGEESQSQNIQHLYEIAFSLTSELILLELTHRVVVCFFEAYCLWKTGATPGKTMLGLRVVHSLEIVALPQMQFGRGPMPQQQPQPQLPPLFREAGAILVRPGVALSFSRALLRSALKNFSLAFFFPLAFTLFHFENSRTLYDIMAHSVVVQVL